ncbi:MAG: methyltransferase domain-containing protein, partial [Planctomycetota bacterium]
MATKSLALYFRAMGSSLDHRPERSLTRSALRLFRKGIACAVVAWTVAAVVSWAAGGVFVPPVITAPTEDSWGQVSAFYPDDREEIEIQLSSAGDQEEITLRGIHFASDPGGPLVVHFAGSGVSLRSVLSSLHFKLCYMSLAERGFASLAVDYRGVGRSSGEPSPTRIYEDASAVWQHALGLVDGDPGRIILRGCSIGTVAIAELLHSGANPGAVVAIAPVEPATVAIRYGLAWLPGPTAWLARPFLRPFASACVTDELTRAEAPRLVIAHPEDELLGRDAFETLVKDVTGTGGIVHEAANIPGVLVRFGPVVDFMPHHIGLAHVATDVSDEEMSFLTREFADQLPAESRLEAAIAAMSPEAKRAVEASPIARERLRTLCSRQRFLPADLAAALCTSLDDEDFEASLESRTWPISHAALERAQLRWHYGFDDLLAMVSLDDPTGPLTPEEMSSARLLGMTLPRDPETHRTRRDVLVGLAEFALPADPSAVPPMKIFLKASGETGHFERDAEGAVYWVESGEGGRPKKLYRLEDFLALTTRAKEAQMIAMRRRYFSWLDVPEGSRGLEIGSGPGHVSADLLESTDLVEVVGLDPSPVLVAGAKAMFSDTPGLSFVEGDARSTELPEQSFELVVLHTSLCHIPG